jgi:hypothetical protein
MLEERRRNRSGGEGPQKGWVMDDTDLIESTLYLNETTAYQEPLTDDEKGGVLVPYVPGKQGSIIVFK